MGLWNCIAYLFCPRKYRFSVLESEMLDIRERDRQPWDEFESIYTDRDPFVEIIL